MKTYATIQDVIDYEIEPALGEHAADYDMEAIARELWEYNPEQGAYTENDDAADFWDAASWYERSETEYAERFDAACKLAGIYGHPQTIARIMDTIDAALDLVDVRALTAEQLGAVLRAAKLSYDKGLADGKAMR